MFLVFCLFWPQELVVHQPDENEHLHNDDPNAEKMWMPEGSFWTQPKGEVHITAAKGETNIAYIEIESGPYLVKPKEEAFDSGERPVNIDPSNLVWVKSSNAHIAHLWGSLGEGESNGTFLKLPAGFSGRINSSGSTFRAVVVKGGITHQAGRDVVEPGGLFSSDGAAVHGLSTKDESIVYIRTDGSYSVR